MPRKINNALAKQLVIAKQLTEDILFNIKTADVPIWVNNKRNVLLRMAAMIHDALDDNKVARITNKEGIYVFSRTSRYQVCVSSPREQKTVKDLLDNCKNIYSILINDC